MAADYYALLGVSRAASQDEIKRAYRKLAREYHPDTSAHGDAEERFKQISAAYEVLSDPGRRERYDTFGTAENAAPNFGGFGDLGDIMETFFGSGFGTRRPRGPRPAAQRGNDLETTLKLTFREAAFGVTKEVSLYAAAMCESCKGSGCEPGTFRIRCEACAGAGEVRSVQRSIFGTMMTSRACGRCDGTGEVAADPCRTCAGDGRMSAARMVAVEVPGGIEHGTTLRVRGHGEAGVRGGEAGDLYVHMSVDGDPVFHREGDDLVCRLSVPLTQAILGAQILVDSLDGAETIKVPPGTQPGAVVRLGGKGIQRLGGRGRGDLVVHLDIEIPRKLSAEQRAIVEQLADVRGELPGDEPSKKARLRDKLRGK
jgi:molecular chaperone DnaJ